MRAFGRDLRRGMDRDASLDQMASILKSLAHIIFKKNIHSRFPMDLRFYLRVAIRFPKKSENEDQASVPIGCNGYFFLYP